MTDKAFSQRQLTRRLWVLVLLGLLSSIAIAAYIAWSLDAVGDKNTANLDAQQQMQLTLEQLRSRVGESHANTQALLTDDGEFQAQTVNPGLDALEDMVWSVGQDVTARLRLDELGSQVLAMRSLWKRALEWHRNFALLAQDVGEERSLGLVRQRLQRLQASINSLEGRHNLHLAKLQRQWKTASGEAFTLLAKQIREELAQRWPRALQSAKTEAAELARTIELLGAQQQQSAVADIRDNRIKPAMDRLAGQLAILDARPATLVSSEPAMQPMIKAISSALFGTDHSFDAADQTIVIGHNGLFRLQQNHLELVQAREALKKDAARQLASSYLALDSLAQAAATQVTAANEQAGATLGTVLTRMALAVGAQAIIFLSMGFLISRHIRRQFTRQADEVRV
jgi:hypothetical protein